MQPPSKTSFLLPHLLPVALLALAATLTAGALATEDTAAAASNSPQRVALAAGQAQAVAMLLDARPRRPAPLLLFTDPNKDPDDLSVLVLASALQALGFIDLRCVVTTLGDRQTRVRRARFAKHALEELGLERVRVGAGADYRFEVKDAKGALDSRATEGRWKDHQVFIGTTLGRPRGPVRTNGLALLEVGLARVPTRSAVLLVNAGMTDLAALLRDAPGLVRRKTAKVVIMGGVDPKVDAQGFVSADARAYNNTTDQPSADYVYARVQALGIPLVVVAKEAAYAAAVPRRYYDGMAATRHPIGVYLRDQQKESLEQLWAGIHRAHLPPALTPRWFFQTFTDLDPDSPDGQAALARAEADAADFESVWGQVSKVNLYDPLALLAATPGLSERLFRKEVLPGTRGDVQAIGAGSIKDPQLVKAVMSGLAIRGLSQ